MPEKLLIIDDDPHVLEAARLALLPSFAEVVTASTLPSLSRLEDVDAVLLDMNYGPGEHSGREGLAALASIRSRDPSLSVVCVTAFGEIDLAVEAMRRGAVDFLVKPWANERLVSTVKNAVALTLARRASAATPAAAHSATDDDPERLEPIAVSAAMKQCWALAGQVANSDANVLILGENGVGKEVVATEIHRRSRRHDRPFVAVDLGALPENLAESELFGHKKGAFSGAADDRVGRVVAAHGGTLFLDELANASLAVQAKLLRVIEQRALMPLGADAERKVDVRFIAATNASDEHLYDPEKFRIDLLFRLRTVEIRVPPLRDRPEDLAEMVPRFIERFAVKYGRDPAPVVSAAAWRRLESHRWPGNVRELRQAVERAMITSTGQALTPEDFHLVTPPQTSKDDGERFTKAAVTLEALERAAVQRALERHQGNVTRAAAELGITRSAMYRRMEKYGL